MASNPQQKELREVNTRIKVKNEELNRLKEEVKALKARRLELKSALEEVAPVS
ncbi:hypothetical protein [Natronohydrobacter thiooxidans]|uniref:hypothetical protein n=1 Tax=Natronohydrobacter thiooxidans TaxID=87172 RepID=UPI000B156187|nr:hypothetical protein [Natronohydrobacter thiooxidans]